MNAKYLFAQQHCLPAGISAGSLVQLTRTPGCAVLEHPTPKRLHPPALSHQILAFAVLNHLSSPPLPQPQVNTLPAVTRLGLCSAQWQKIAKIWQSKLMSWPATNDIPYFPVKPVQEIDFLFLYWWQEDAVSYVKHFSFLKKKGNLFSSRRFKEVFLSCLHWYLLWSIPQAALTLTF